MESWPTVSCNWPFKIYARIPHFSVRVPYAALTKAFSLIEGTTKRLEKNAILTSFLLLVIQRSAKGDSKFLLQAVYLCINRVSSPLVFADAFD